VARFGGDEFVAVCDDLKSTAEAELLTGRIVQALTGEWHIDGKTLNVDVSIGCALTSSATPPLMLLHDADEAMYRAKQLLGTRSVLSASR
jgi:diguanylate cyclase (GGDEF)-like protein